MDNFSGCTGEVASVTVYCYRLSAVELKHVHPLPEAELWLLTEGPSGGLSPTMLGSWMLGGGEKAGGPCSCSNFFGTAERRVWGEEGRKKQGKKELDV